MFVDVTPAIVVSNARDDCDGDEFETGDECYSVREVCISFGMVAWSGGMWQHVSCSTISITGVLRW